MNETSLKLGVFEQFWRFIAGIHEYLELAYANVKSLEDK